MAPACKYTLSMLMKTFSLKKTLQSWWMRHYFFKADSVKLYKQTEQKLVNGYTCSNAPTWVSTFGATNVRFCRSKFILAWKNSSLETLNLSSQVQRFKKSFALIKPQLLIKHLSNCFPQPKTAFICLIRKLLPNLWNCLGPLLLEASYASKLWTVGPTVKCR